MQQLFFELVVIIGEKRLFFKNILIILCLEPKTKKKYIFLH